MRKTVIKFKLFDSQKNEKCHINYNRGCKY